LSKSKYQQESRSKILGDLKELSRAEVIKKLTQIAQRQIEAIKKGDGPVYAYDHLQEMIKEIRGKYGEEHQ
tara:strand:- start:299 stop:511 length:213 start_codon:yes stop_codon:yes gene_type:complete